MQLQLAGTAFGAGEVDGVETVIETVDDVVDEVVDGVVDEVVGGVVGEVDDPVGQVQRPQVVWQKPSGTLVEAPEIA